MWNGFLVSYAFSLVRRSWGSNACSKKRGTQILVTIILPFLGAYRSHERFATMRSDTERAIPTPIVSVGNMKSPSSAPFSFDFLGALLVLSRSWNDVDRVSVKKKYAPLKFRVYRK